MKLLFALCCSLPGLMAQDPQAWQVHAQATTVTQTSGGFASPYQGPNSFRPDREWATSFTTTLMTGWSPLRGTELYLDLEGAAGKGVSGVLGMAGAPNGETCRVGNPAFRVSVARVLLRQTFDLGGETRKVEEDAHAMAALRTSRRLVLHLGKFSVMDVFDNNTHAHDPRTQFLNWTLMGHGAWDYPADTRGYTWGAAAELYWDDWVARCGRFAEPRQANQLEMDHAFARVHGDALEVEHDHTLGGLPGAVRWMAFQNTAAMGDYRLSLAEGNPPDITATRAPGRRKHGWGINAEQAATADLGFFVRWSWSDGRTESWAFTEADRSVSTGLSLKGASWGRPQDRFGLAFVQNGLSPDHRDYLAAGGLGFLLGDGRLRYKPEGIVEAIYALSLGRTFTASLDLQRCWNPGYNADRGPVTLAALRLHLAF